MLRTSNEAPFAAALRLLPALATGLILFTFAARGVAQDAPTPPPPAVPAMAIPLFNALDDIDHLNVITPLKLTPAQLDKLIATLSDAEATYQARVNTLTVEFLSRSRGEIESVRSSALAGSPVPASFVARVNEVLKKRDALQNDSLKFVGKQFGALLTPEQITTVVSLAKHYKPGTGTNAQWINYYVLNVFLKFQRTVPLLKELRGAATQ